MSDLPNPPPVVHPRPQRSSAGNRYPVPSPEPGTLLWVFVGTQGIRAGWSLLIYCFILAALAVPTLFGVALILGPPKGNSLARAPVAIAFEWPLVGVCALAALAMALIERRKFSSYWLRDSHLLKKFVAGSIGGFLAMAGLVGALSLGHFLVFDRVLLSGAEIVKFGLLWLLAFLGVGAFEELFSRGYSHFTLTRGVSFFWSSLITSTLFAALHLSNGGESAVGISSVFCAGLLLCFLLKVTGSLYFSIGFHAMWDWTQSFLFGVADSGTVSAGRLMGTHPVGSPLWSGGTAGPEGSLLVFPTMALVALICWRLYRPKPAPPIPTA